MGEFKALEAGSSPSCSRDEKGAGLQQQTAGEPRRQRRRTHVCERKFGEGCGAPLDDPCCERCRRARPRFAVDEVPPPTHSATGPPGRHRARVASTLLVMSLRDLHDSVFAARSTRHSVSECRRESLRLEDLCVSSRVRAGGGVRFSRAQRSRLPPRQLRRLRLCAERAPAHTARRSVSGTRRRHLTLTVMCDV